jgi:hypothetical protein
MLRRMSVGSFGSVGEHFRRLTRPAAPCFSGFFSELVAGCAGFFLLIMCIPAIAAEFHTQVSSVAEAVFLTLIFRPVGALSVWSDGRPLWAQADADG